MSSSAIPTPDPGSLRHRLARARLGVRRRLALHRRGLAAVLAAVAVLVGVHDLRPPAARTVTVWTFAHDLPGGQPLGAGDVRRSSYPPQTVPDGSVRAPGPLLGRTVAAPVRRGEPLTDLSVVGPPLFDAQPDRVAVPVRIADAGVVALLRVGDRVDLVAVDPDARDQPPRVVAVGARVLALPESDAPSVAGAQDGRLLLASVLPTEAGSVAAAGLAGYLTLTLTP